MTDLLFDPAIIPEELHQLAGPDFEVSQRVP